MINNDNGDNMANNDDKPTADPKDEKESTFFDLAWMDVQCHLMIKDKDTGEVIVNKRG